MFICVSLNPGIDKRLRVPSLVAGEVHRARSAQSFPGGKAAHVAMVLRTLGEIPHWIGFCGGATGAELARGLSTYGVLVHPCETQRLTRTNLEIIDDDNTVTEILEPGCAPSARELAEFEILFTQTLLQANEPVSVVFSGSLPAGAAADLYARLISLAHESHARTFLDSSGDPLRRALSARPHFVKPNREEAAALFGLPIDSVAVAAEVVRGLIQRGAESAALSLGAEGLLFCPVENARILLATPPRLKCESSVGAGDSAVAGFAQAMFTGADAEESLRLATACAAANCLADSPGAARLQDIQRLRNEIRVETLNTN